MNKQVFATLVNVGKFVLGPVVLAVVIWLNWHKETSDGKEVGLCRIFLPGFEFNWLLFGAALAVAVLGMLLTFVRWYVLVRAQDLPFTLGKAVQLGFIGSFFNSFLPGSVAGDIPKVVVMARDQRRRTVAVATIIVDRVVGLCGLIWLSALLGTLFWLDGSLGTILQAEHGSQTLDLELIVQVAWVLVAGSLVFWFLLGFLPLGTTTKWIAWLEGIPKIGHPLAEMVRATLMYRSRSMAMALAMLLAIIGHVAFVLAYYCCSLLMNPGEQLPSWGTHFLIVPTGMIGQAFFPTPGGMGGGEYFFGALYQWAGAVGALGVAAAVLRRVLELVLATFGFVLYWRMKPALPTVPAEPTVAAVDTRMEEKLQPVP